MDFLHYALLGFLPLAGLPILLHLLTLHRLRTVELPTYRFLFDSYVQQRRKMQFLEALLALLRTLFLLGLVAAFARPAAKTWAGLFPGGSGREVVLLVDGSASMNAKAKGLSALDRAKDVARSVVATLSAEDRVAVVKVADRPEEVARRFVGDGKAVVEAIDGLSPGPSRANLFAAMAEVYGSTAGRSSRPTVYVLSDGQSGSWRELRDPSASRLVPEGAKIVVVNVGEPNPPANRAVIGDPPGKARAVVGLPVTLRPRVIGDAKGDEASATLSVSLDDKEVARLPVILKPGEAIVKKVVYVPEASGTLRGRFEVSGKAPDGFPDDDSYLFTLTVDPAVKVLIVNGNPSADPFEDEALYLRTALSARSGEGSGPLAAPLKSLDVRETPEGGLNPDSLRDAAVVILANCGGLNAQHFAWLREFVNAGGGLLILPGDRVNPDVYNTQFFAAPGPSKEKITGVTLGPPEGDPEKAETFERLSTVDFAHPALSVFDSPDARYLRSAHFGRRFPLNFPDGKPVGAWPLAVFASGRPALVESRFGSGIVLVSAFPANAKWSNLPLKPEFVPLVLRLAGYVQGRPELDVPATVPPDGRAEIGVASAWSPATGTVTDPGGKPSPLAFERSNGRWIAPYDRTEHRGYYSVEVKGGKVEAPKAGSAAFAVNLAPEESRFAAITEAQIRQALPRADVSFVDASAEAQRAEGKIGERKEVWRGLILLLFGIIGVEFLLATLGGKASPSPSGA